MKKKPKKPPKQRLVYEGLQGRCPCCDRATEIRLGGTLGYPPNTPWIISENVLKRIYCAVAARIKEKDGKLYVTDPSKYDATRKSKLFFVDADDAIAGPFGHTGLKVFIRSYFDTNTDNIRVYIVTTTDRALRLIRNSPFTEESYREGDIDKLEDLF